MQPVPRWKLLVVLVALVASLAVVWAIARAPLGSCTTTVHLGTQLAGNSERLAKHLQPRCSSVSIHELRMSLLLDAVLALTYAAGLAYYLRLAWRGWLITRLTKRRMVWVLPLGAGALDLLENLLTCLGVRHSSGGLAFRSDRWAVAISTAAWSKWLLLGATAVAVITATWATMARRPSLGTPPPSVDLPRGGVGVCCSGGGIRAAGFTIGALETLERRGILREARWLSAVSGGAYAAGAYATGRAAVPEMRLPELRSWLLGDPYPPHETASATATAKVSSRPFHSYLARGPGGLARSALWMLGCIVFNAVVVAAAVITVAWPVGVLYRTWAFNDSFPRYSTTSAWRWPASHQWEGGLILVGVALLVLIGWFLLRAAQQGDHSLFGAGVAVAGVLAALGVAQLALLLVAPMILQLDGWIQQLAAQVTTTLVFGFSLTAIGGFLWKLMSKRAVRAAPRLGGVLLALLLLWLGAYVTDCQIRGRGAFHSPWVVVPISLGFVALFTVVGIGWTSGRLMYRSRLRASFTPRSGSVTWADLTARRDKLADTSDPMPELLICATAQRGNDSQNGFRADSFTISPTTVGYQECQVPTGAYVAAFTGPRGASAATVSDWMATSGAAFSSAMGRFSYGSTNALLAATNIDLGEWVPSPTRVAEGWQRFPSIRLGYLVKEILGIYDPKDSNLFVADGGQWENLGLVELFRRRCEVAVCLDASGDSPNTFTTLRQAVQLAVTELPGVHVDLGFLDGLKAGEFERAPRSVGSAVIEYPDAPAGLLLYAKAQVSADLPIELLRYAAQDPKFPHYSTGNQFLSDAAFRNLVALGGVDGELLTDLVEEYRTLQG